MKKCSKKLFLLITFSILLISAFMLCANAADIEAEIKSGSYGEPVASGDCYNASGSVYNAKWSLYNSKTSGKYVIYFSLDTTVSSNTELVLGFDPSKNSGSGGVVGGWGANLTNTKYPWSSYHTNIDTLVIGEGVTKMASPFYGATSLKTMEIPATLTSITIPASVTGLPSKTFDNCSALECVTFLGNTTISVVSGAETLAAATENKDVPLQDVLLLPPSPHSRAQTLIALRKNSVLQSKCPQTEFPASLQMTVLQIFQSISGAVLLQ